MNSKKLISIAVILCLLFSQVSIIALAEGIFEPQIGDKVNAADSITVLNNGVNITDEYKESKTVNILPNTRGYINGPYFNSAPTDSTYYYSADVNIIEDSSSYGSIRFVLGYGIQNGVKNYFELCYRPGLNQAVSFLNGQGETALEVTGGNGLKYNTAYHCVAVYEKGRISFWANGECILNGADLPNSLTDIVLESGFYSQNCSGTLSNIEIWGDVESVACPKIENKTNLINKVIINDPAGNTQKISANGYLGYAGTNTNRTVFEGIMYGEWFFLSADARFYDNKLLNGENEINWEGLIFKVASVTDGNGDSYDLEVRVRNSLIAVFAVSPNSERVIDVKYGLTYDYGKNYHYTVAFHKNNTISFWINEEIMLNHFDVSEFEYTVNGLSASLGGEVCGYVYENIKLWGDITSVATEEQISSAKNYDLEYNREFNTDLPQKPLSNENYMSNADVFISGNGISYDNNILNAECVNSVGNAFFYLDKVNLKKLKKDNFGRELNKSEFFYSNAVLSTPFTSFDEIAYSFSCDIKNAELGSLSLAVRGLKDKNNPFKLILTNENITALNGLKTESARLPENISLEGEHIITIKMSADYAVLFLDGKPCICSEYENPSIPLFSVTIENADITMSDFSAYKLSIGDISQEIQYEKGDINKDDYIDLRDIIRYKKIFSEIAVGGDLFTSDINSDGSIDTTDMVGLKRVLLNDGRGLKGPIQLFHDQSKDFLSDIQPDYNEDISLKIRVKTNTVTNASIKYSTDKINWKTASMFFSGEDKTGYYQYFTGIVPGQKNGFYYYFCADNQITGMSKEIKSLTDKKLGWYCMVGQKTPDWAKGALWYSLVPDAFYNGDLTNDKLNSGSTLINSWNNPHTGLADRYGGDLSGIEQKLPHIKSLGVDAIYTNPISKSNQNCGYGTIDYNQIEPSFGNSYVLNRLVNKIHNENMRFMTDVVLYFTPTDSIYINERGFHPLNGAMQSRYNKYTQMFKFTNWPDYELTEWGGLFTNLFNNAMQEMLYKSSQSALRRLVDSYSVDGLRFDCGGYLGSKSDFNIRNTLIKDIRSYLKSENNDMLMLTEYDYPGMTGYGWDSQWNLDLRNAFDVYITGQTISGETYRQNTVSIRDVLRRSLYNLPRQQALTIQNLISFHDDDRIDVTSPYGMSAVLTQMTCIGSPVIYYGQEIGLNRTSEEGLTQISHAGSSFYSMDWNEENWNGELLHFYKALGRLRGDYTALKTGSFEEIDCDSSKSLLAFARYDGNGAVVTLANSGSKINDYEFETAGFGIKDGDFLTDYFSGKSYIVKNGSVTVDIPSGGTLLVTGEADKDYSEKELKLYGSGSASARVTGEGVYSITLSEKGDNSAFYGVVVNKSKAYVIARTKAGQEVIKQTETELPQNAELVLSRSNANLFSVKYRENGVETEMPASGVEISMDRDISVSGKILGGAVAFDEFCVNSNGVDLLLDDFSTVTKTAIFNGDAIIENGTLIISEKGSVETAVPSDDWTAETRLVFGKGGIKAIKDSENYLALRYSDGLQLVKVTGGNREIIETVECTAENGIYLQLSRVGTDFTAYYSLDGISWNNVGYSLFYNPSVVKLSLFAEDNAGFDYIKFGDTVSYCTPHIFPCNDFGYYENKNDAKFETVRGAWEYTAEGIEVTSNGDALMTVTNRQYNNFSAQATFSASGGSSKVGFAFGMNNINSVDDAYTLYFNENILIFKKGNTTLKRTAVSGKYIAIRMINGVISVYGGNSEAFIFNLKLSDYSGGYFGFFSNTADAKILNYYVSDVADGWQTVGYDVWGNSDYLTVQSRYDNYGVATYRGYALTNGTINATVNVSKKDEQKDFYGAGFLLGTAYGKSPQNNGIFVGIETGRVVLKYKGEIVAESNIASQTVNISISVNAGYYKADVDDIHMEYYAPDCSGGCISFCAYNSCATVSNMSVLNPVNY